MVALIGLVRRKLTLAEMRDALLETAKTTGMIFLILLGAELLKIFTARGGVPQAMAGMMAASGLAPMTTLILLLTALILLGCLMDSLSIILLAIPFFWPVLVEINGGDWVTAANSPFGMTTEDLVWDFGADRGRTWPDHAASRHERLYHLGPDKGCPDARYVPGRSALLRRRTARRDRSALAAGPCLLAAAFDRPVITAGSLNGARYLLLPFQDNRPARPEVLGKPRACLATKERHSKDL